MDKIPDNIVNKKLYLKAKKEADETYKRHSAYKSMFISKKYKELGGKYKTSKKDDKLENWRNENWISVSDFLNGKVVNCGQDDIGNNACRPMFKINKDTPLTIYEVLKLHSIDKIKAIVKMKKKNMDLRIDWKKLSFH